MFEYPHVHCLLNNDLWFMFCVGIAYAFLFTWVGSHAHFVLKMLTSDTNPCPNLVVTVAILNCTTLCRSVILNG